MNLSEYCQQQIENLKSEGRFRAPKNSERLKNNIIKRNGKKLISFSCNDYLGLSHHPEVIKASISEAKKYGASSSASRLISGNNILYSKLESEVSKLHNTQASTIFSSGYAANLGTIKALMQKGDLIILDKLAHSCMIEGAQASGAEVKRFLHNNYANLEKILSENCKKYKNILIATESVFSMDGDKADLPKIRLIAETYNAWLLVDYAHDIEVFAYCHPQTLATHSSLRTNLSERGNLREVKSTRLLRSLKLTRNDEDAGYANEIKMGTFSKALGSLGGYITGSSELIDFINSKATTLIYSTALTPSVLAASIKAIQIAKKNKSLAKKALENAAYFFKELRANEMSVAIHPEDSTTPHLLRGLPNSSPQQVRADTKDPRNDAESQIVPIIIGDTEKTIKLSAELAKRGFLLHPIKPPTVPENSSRLRVSFSATHTKKQIDGLVKSLIKLI